MADWAYFPNEEFERIGSDSEKMDPEFMEMVVDLRRECRFPFPLTSAWRASKGSAHPEGKAIDIAISGPNAFILIGLAFKHRFTGIGTRQHGKWSERFVHLDTVAATPDRPRPAIWTYDRKET